MGELKMFGFAIKFIPGLGGCCANPDRGWIELDPDWADLIRKFPGIICHEVGHLVDPRADWHCLLRPGMTNLQAQVSCLKAHYSKKAMSFEVTADKKAVDMGEGHSLLEALKYFKTSFGAAAGADIDDRITRLEVWENTGIFVEDGRTDLPSDEELRAAGIDPATLEAASLQTLLAAHLDPNALAK